jgi:hypothetical protein
MESCARNTNCVRDFYLKRQSFIFNKRLEGESGLKNGEQCSSNTYVLHLEYIFPLSYYLLSTLNTYDFRCSRRR